MFVKWIKEHDLADFSFSNPLFPPACDRAFWDAVTDEGMAEGAQEYLGYEWPLIRASQYMALKTDGNRLAQERPHFARPP